MKLRILITLLISVFSLSLAGAVKSPATKNKERVREPFSREFVTHIVKSIGECAMQASSLYMEKNDPSKFKLVVIGTEQYYDEFRATPTRDLTAEEKVLLRDSLTSLGGILKVSKDGLEPIIRSLANVRKRLSDIQPTDLNETANDTVLRKLTVNLLKLHIIELEYIKADMDKLDRKLQDGIESLK